MKKHKKLPPWKRPVQWLWLFLAMGLSLYLIGTMPAKRDTDNVPVNFHTIPAQSPVSSDTSSPLLQEEVAGMSAPAGKTAEKNPGKSSEKASAKVSERTARRAMGDRHHNAQTPSSLWEKVKRKAPTIGKLLLMVSLAALIGSIAEARKWHLVFGYILGRFSRLMRLPSIVGLAMPTALYSNTAANSMLVSSHGEGKISRSSLIAGGMANSYLSYLSHALRVMYPVVGAVGIPGLLFFGGQFFMGFLFILSVLLWHRGRMIRREDSSGQDDTNARAYEQPLTWGGTTVLSLQRVGTLLFRMMILTVPLMILVEWMMKKGLFDFWEKFLPDWINRIFPPELLTIVAAQFGGLIQAASVAASLRSHDTVTNAQIMLALFVGSAIGNPFRTMRRNLPSALGIFPAKEAFTIVLGMQISRMVGTLILIALSALFIHFTHP